MSKRAMGRHGAYFRRLSQALNHPGMPSQVEIARDLGTDQPFVSHASRAELVRITDRVRRLRRYAIMRLREIRTEDGVQVRDVIVAEDVIGICRRYVADGYDARVLADQIELLRRAQSGSRW